MKINDTTTAILVNTTSNKAGFKALKAAGLKPWTGTEMHPHTWMRKALDFLHGVESQVSTGFADDKPCVITTTTPEDILEAKMDKVDQIMEEVKEDINVLFGRDITKVFNPTITEIVVKEDKEDKLNWIAQLQMTELPVTFEDEEGHKESMDNRAMFELAHDEEMGKRAAELDSMTTLFMQGEILIQEQAAKAAKKTAKKAYQLKLQAQKEQEQAAKAEAQKRAKELQTKEQIVVQVTKRDPNFRAKCKKMKAKRVANLNHIEKTYVEFVNSLPTEIADLVEDEYIRLTKVCLVTTSKAMMRLMRDKEIIATPEECTSHMTMAKAAADRDLSWNQFLVCK